MESIIVNGVEVRPRHTLPLWLNIYVARNWVLYERWKQREASEIDGEE